MSVFGPLPSQYMNRYKQCLVSLADGTMRSVCVDRYLSKPSGVPPDAFEDLVEALSDKTGTPRYSVSYNLDGRRVHLGCFKMPFMGKGSPFDIKQAIFAASWCGLVDLHTLQRYCDENMGLDCNGFASNLFRLDRNTSVASFDDKANRLDSAQRINTRTVLIWVNATGVGKSHTHIAVVESVTSVDLDRQVVDFQVVHAEGGRAGLHQERFFKRFAIDEEGRIFFDATGGTPTLSSPKLIYAVPPPNNSIPND